MTEPFLVKLINSSSCFFSFNERTLRTKLKGDVKGYSIHLKYGTSLEKTFYGSYDPQPKSSVNPGVIGVPHRLARTLMLKDDDPVLVTWCDVCSVNKVHIRPKSEADYLILEKYRNTLEYSLLNQLRIVAVGQILPIHVFGNIDIDICVVELEPRGLSHGQLEKFTELVILTHSTMGNIVIGPDVPETSMNAQTTSLAHLFHQVNSYFTKKPKTKEEGSEDDQDPLLSIKLEEEKQVLRVVPWCCLRGNKNDHIVTGYKFGEYVGKKAWALEVLEEKKLMLGLRSVHAKKGERVVHCNVVHVDGARTDHLYCSDNIMEMFNLSVGSRVVLLNTVPGGLVESVSVRSKVPKVLPVFWDSALKLRMKIRMTIKDNVSLGHISNILLTGSAGTGKTFLLTSLIEVLAREGLYVGLVPCKGLRGKTVDILLKLFVEKLSECAYRQPSVLLLDDLDTIMHSPNQNDNEVKFNNLYVARIGGLLSETIRSFQQHSLVTIVTSCQSPSHLGDGLVSSRGPSLYDTVLDIAEMKTTERIVMLRYLLPTAEATEFAERFNGFNIQDLVDLVGRVQLKGQVRGDGLFVKEDLEEALQDTVPLSLRGVDLFKDIPYRWSDVGGLTKAKEVLMEVFTWPSRYPEIFSSCPLRHQSGVLLYGAPGTGKTLLAGALASESGLNLISVKGPELLSKYVGSSEEGVRNVFRRAQKAQPCILLFDEFDSLAPRRGHDSTGVTDRVVNQLLTQLDGVEALTGVWVLAATSRPDLLDPALLRPGRLDRAVHCALPSQEQRLDILTALSRNLQLAAGASLLPISEQTEGFTGADLQAVLYAAQMASIKEIIEGAARTISQHHLEAALAETKPSLSPMEKLKYQRIYERFLNSGGADFSQEHSGMQQKITFA